ncbi:MAG TPA: BCD family MFS transporter [Anaerolineales bacterium]|nr:BCD family MFS transporter [Anaerolineales bacterium]
MMVLQRIQLGLIHSAVAMTLVPINSTLNRVMIKELAISATLVALLASLPYLFSPIQVAIGSFSDRHPVGGYRRTPYILLGLLLCVTGVLISPLAAFNIAANFWLGILLGALAFGAWGMGYNLAAVSYLSLASEISGENGRGRTVAVMWFMMISSIILTAITLSQLVDPYTPEALVRAFWVIGLLALFLGLIGLVRLEKRVALGAQAEASDSQSWLVLARGIAVNRQATLFFWYLIVLLAALLGQDILLEPFAAEAFEMSVRQTTRITAIWGVCVLAALAVAGFLETRIGKRKVANFGGWAALVGFFLIAFSGLWISGPVFYLGVVLLGFGTGLSTVANLGLMLDMTTAGSVGLFIGAWGMANAISRLLGSLIGGGIRDLLTQALQSPVLAYVIVFIIMGLFLLISIFMLRRIDVSVFRQQSQELSLVERAAAATDA